MWHACSSLLPLARWRATWRLGNAGSDGRRHVGALRARLLWPWCSISCATCCTRAEQRGVCTVPGLIWGPSCLVCASWHGKWGPSASLKSSRHPRCMRMRSTQTQRAIAGRPRLSLWLSSRPWSVGWRIPPQSSPRSCSWEASFVAYGQAAGSGTRSAAAQTASPSSRGSSEATAGGPRRADPDSLGGAWHAALRVQRAPLGGLGGWVPSANFGAPPIPRIPRIS